MTAIHRKQVDLHVPFKAPRQVTFGYQTTRGAFSAWYSSSDPADCQYVAVTTGVDLGPPVDLVATVIVDGFDAVHLVRVKPVQVNRI